MNFAPVRTDYQSAYSDIGRQIGGAAKGIGQNIQQGIRDVREEKDATIRRHKDQLSVQNLQSEFEMATKDKESFNKVKSMLVEEVKENFKDMPAERRDRAVAAINSVSFEDGKGLQKLQSGLSNLGRMEAITKQAQEEGVKLRGWDPTEIMMPDAVDRMQKDYERMRKDSLVGKAVLETEKTLDEQKPKTMEEAFSLLPQEVTKHQEVTDYIKKRYMKEKDARDVASREVKARATARAKGADKTFNNVTAPKGGQDDLEKKLKEAKKNLEEREVKVLTAARKLMLRDQTLNVYEAQDMAEKQFPPEPEEQEKPGFFKRLFGGGESEEGGMPTVATKEEWQQLPPGTQYKAPDGSTRIKK